MTDAGLFAIGQYEEGNAVSLCGYRQCVPIDTRKRFPSQFIVEWKFSDSQPNGLPSTVEHEQAVALEQMIRAPLESDGAAILAIITTGNGYRELYFYCRDPQLLASRFNDVVKGRELPVELHAGFDPDWKVYQQFTAPFTGSTEP